MIWEEGVKSDPNKTACISKRVTLQNVKDIQKFLDFVYYYKHFIKNLCELEEPLRALTRKNNKFEWSKKQQTFFETLKDSLIGHEILTHPDFTEEFIFDCYASATGLEIVLSQYGDKKNLKVIRYSSSLLTQVERRYSATKK
ncbi:Retrovirus-related Pol polyprotein [Thelohanellus kitauei]|uniref:Retrovirus-related Pol polyprotein n=1 Tax=Thelohanellus kitauei TaxID=669202 RepID=A0A0C2JEU6_THEKT|nr:Retrovirus-related Pol polyprotein [Thelohanellus kitauei]